MDILLLTQDLQVYALITKNENICFYNSGKNFSLTGKCISVEFIPILLYIEHVFIELSILSTKHLQL